MQPMTYYIYKLVTVPVNFQTTQPQHLAYQEVIHHHASDGWRLVQIFLDPTLAVPQDYVLIFERPDPNQNEA